MIEKGIILAGGSGTRLYPATLAVGKQLLPVYNRPMIYFPLAALMQAGVRTILIITRPEEEALFRGLLGDGGQWGLDLRYQVQDTPRGIADAFLVGESFVAGDPVALILGDNLFHGDGLEPVLTRAVAMGEGATVLARKVPDPERYGVVGFGFGGRVISLEEKPEAPQSDYAVTGLYFYDGTVCERARSLRPSARGELEITDLNRLYLSEGTLKVETLDPTVAWLDTGTHGALLEASQFVALMERQHGVQIASPEAIAFARGWIDADQLMALARPMDKTTYGRHLAELAQTGAPASPEAPAAVTGEVRPLLVGTG